MGRAYSSPWRPLTIGLLIVHPVADVTDTRLGQQLGCSCGFSKLRPSQLRALPRWHGSRGLHGAWMYSAPSGSDIRRDHAATEMPCPINSPAAPGNAHQERIILSGEDIHGNGGLDPVPIQTSRTGKMRPVAILAMRPGRERRGRVPGHSHRRDWVAGSCRGGLHIHVLEGHDNAQITLALPGQVSAARVVSGRPGIMVVSIP